MTNAEREQNQSSESVWQLKIEGENKLFICSAVKDIAKIFGVSNKTALKFFCRAISYCNLNMAIWNQISYMLKMGLISKD